MARSSYIYLVYATYGLERKLVGAYTVKYQSEQCTARALELDAFEPDNLLRYRVSDGNYHVGKPCVEVPCPWETVLTDYNIPEGEQQDAN